MKLKDAAFRVLSLLRMQRKAGCDVADAIVRWTQSYRRWRVALCPEHDTKLLP